MSSNALTIMWTTKSGESRLCATGTTEVKKNQGSMSKVWTQAHTWNSWISDSTTGRKTRTSEHLVMIILFCFLLLIACLQATDHGTAKKCKTSEASQMMRWFYSIYSLAARAEEIKIRVTDQSHKKTSNQGFFHQKVTHSHRISMSN